MPRMLWLPFVIMTLLGACAPTIHGSGGAAVVPPRPPGATYPNWEFLCLDGPLTSSSLVEFLNAAGAQGWDLVTTSPACVKRPASALVVQTE